MVIKGEALIGSFTLGFAIHGQRNDWHVSVTAPGCEATECETQESSWYSLFNEMLADGYEAAMRKRYPLRAGAK